MEAQSRNVVQALVRNTAGGRVSVSRSNHNVRLIVYGAKLSTNALNQFITQRLPASQRIEHNNEIALTRSTIHSNESTCVLTSMYATTLLGALTVSHEANLTGLTGNIRRTRTNQVGGSASTLRNRGRSCNLTCGKNCRSSNKAGRANTSKRMRRCLKTRKNRRALLLPCRQGGILFRFVKL